MLVLCVDPGLETDLTQGKVYQVDDVNEDPGGTVYALTGDNGEKAPFAACLFQPVLSDPPTVAGLLCNVLNRLNLDEYTFQEALAEEGLDTDDVHAIVNTLSGIAWPKPKRSFLQRLLGR